MKRKRIIPYVPPEDRCKLQEGCDEKFYLSDVMSRFKKWLRKPLTTKQVIIMYITWVLMILYTIFCK